MRIDRLDRRETEQLNGFLRKTYREIKECNLVAARDYANQLVEHIDLLIMIHEEQTEDKSPPV